MSNQIYTDTKKVSFDVLRKITDEPSSVLHFIGIGGVSMYSLARLAMIRGARVTGSDREESDRTRELSGLGAKITIGHFKENVKGATVIIYTHAVADNNPELVAGREENIPIVTRAEYMGAMMLGYDNRIGVSGSHGKSTTVAMLDKIFSEAKYNPTVLSGSNLDIGEPLKIGDRALMIYEGCEYKDSFLKFTPTVSVGLNLELDHTDYFNNISSMKESFRKALGKATAFSVVNGDDENFRSIIQAIKSKVVTFGQGERNDYRYNITSFRESGFDFDVFKGSENIGSFKTSIPGIFNVSNAVAAIVTALEYGIDKEVIKSAIASFGGIARRLEAVGYRFTRRVFYDYAHHPTEIKASINALKMLTHDLVTVIFKPHTYSRTKSLWEDFRMALSLADHIIITDIYPAREEAISGINSERLALEIGEKAIYSTDEDVVGYLDRLTHGVIVIMGAGDMENIKNSVLNKQFL